MGALRQGPLPEAFPPLVLAPHCQLAPSAALPMPSQGVFINIFMFTEDITGVGNKLFPLLNLGDIFLKTISATEDVVMEGKATIDRVLSRNMEGPRALKGTPYRGGRPVQIRDPHPPPDPPKIFQPVFLQFEILGERVGPKAPKFFLPFLRVFSTLCVYTQNTQNFVENSKMFEKHRKIFDP